MSSQTTGQIGFALLLIGIAAGFVTAIVGGFNLAAPWLLIAYALVLSDLLVLRWATVHTARVPCRSERSSRGPQGHRQ